MLLERLRAETDPACSREEEDLSYRPHTGAGATTLTNTSAIENLSFSEYEDLLVLAQQHFDDLRRTLTNRSGEGRRPGTEVRLLQGKLNDMEQKYEQLLAEMTFKVKSHEEAIIENTSCRIQRKVVICL